VLRAGDKLKLGKRQFEVLHLPGHTPGSIGLYDRSSRLLLTGDSIQGRGVGGHLAMIIDVSSYLAALSEAAKLPVDCLVMDHSYSPFSSAILTGGEVSRFFRESIRTVEQYIAALQAMARGRKQMNLAEATDFLCARFGTRPRSLMAMCTAESILRRLGVAPQ
jgi:glyoxylase-like metal-dependent hydrolase (beta-lactamase superfamily II)